MRSLGQHAASGARSRLLVGTDWLVEGVLSVEAGIDVVLASETAPVPRFAQAIGARKSELNRAGVTFESAENDIVLAGLLRAGMLAGRRTVAMFEMRGFRTALDMLHEAAQIPVRSTGGGVAVLCEPRWRLWPLADLPGPGTAVEPARSGPGNRSRAAVAGRSSGKPSGGATGVGSVREGAEAAARRVSEIIQRGALGSRSSAAGTASDVSPTGGGPGPDASSPPTFALTADRLPWADPRDLASYLGVPMLEPATPEEIRPYLNEAFRLSRASQRMVILWLPPSLIAGGGHHPRRSRPGDPSHRPLARPPWRRWRHRGPAPS